MRGCTGRQPSLSPGFWLESRQLVADSINAKGEIGDAKFHFGDCPPVRV